MAVPNQLETELILILAIDRDSDEADDADNKKKHEARKVNRRLTIQEREHTGS